MSNWSAHEEFKCFDECEPPFPCKGHIMTFSFNDTSDMGLIIIDGEKVFRGGMQHFRALHEVMIQLKEQWD